MMTENDIEHIGYYEIVKRAGMPSASVYHFFPTKQAIVEGLAERYFERFIEKTAISLETKAPDDWRALVAERNMIGSDYYNANPGSMRLILGTHTFLEIRRADDRANAVIAKNFFEYMKSAYHLPRLQNGECKFLTALTIGDAVFRLSYNSFGFITPEFSEESKRAVIAYYRTFLPDYLERKAGAAK